jgi:lipopolysaccharide export system protein LptA
MYPDLKKKAQFLIYGWLIPVAMSLLLHHPWSSSGQKVTRINIEQARTLRVEKKEGKTLQRLVGDVILRQDSTWFYCDSAWKDEGRNYLEAIGNVHISYSDSVDLYGDYLNYDGNTRIAILDSNVILDDNRAILYTDHLLYDRNQKVAFYNQGGRIVDQDNVLTSILGRYYTDTDDFYFRDSVVVTNPDYIMYADTLRYNTETEIVYIFGPTHIYGENEYLYSEDGWYDTQNDVSELYKNNRITYNEQILLADTIYYDDKKGYGRATGNIWMKDTLQKVIMEGDLSEIFRNEYYSYVTGNARGILIDQEDSLFMHADTFRLILDSAENARLLLAYHHIKFFREDMQGMCDSLIYRVNDSVISMRIDPVLWTQSNQLSSDSILMFVTNNRIDSMTLYNMAFIISRDKLGTFDQIKGKEMKGYFRDNELYRINVLGNAETIYFVREDDGAMIGINKLISSNMAIMMEDKKVARIVYYKKPEGKMHPEEDLSGEQRVLKGFDWQENERPVSKDDIFRKRGEGNVPD